MRIDLTGKKFGKLTVLKAGELVKERLYWECLCECGNIKQINGYNLRKGLTNSCGCINKKASGLSSHPFYNTYRHQYDRCNNENNVHYNDYGGRGILCVWTLEEACIWYDENPKPNDECQCDRIDNNGNYCAENVKWSTSYENNMNKRTTIEISKYETIPIVPADFRKACATRGLNYNDFDKTRSEFKSGKNYKYYFKLKE